MANILDGGRVASALQKTWLALNKPEEAGLESAEFSVFAKYWLTHGLDAERGDAWDGASIQRWREVLESRLAELDAALRCYGNHPGPWEGSSGRDLNTADSLSVFEARHCLQFSPRYRQRLIDLALAEILSESLAPEICLDPNTMADAALRLALPGHYKHAVIFADRLLFSHEFYPLAVDALAWSARRPTPQAIAVLAVHVDWVGKDGALSRIVFLDAQRLVLREVEVSPPIQPDCVQFLALGGNEQALHRFWSTRFSCLQVNPYPIAALADNKAATLAGWLAMGLECPRSAKFAGDDMAEARRCAERFAEVVVKPNTATEGAGVAFFETKLGRVAGAFDQHLAACRRYGPVLIQERRDGVMYRDPASGLAHSLALRLNLAFDGGGYAVESGYAQLGQNTGLPASRGRGGGIVSLPQALAGLAPRRDKARFDPVFRDSDWERLCCQAALAAGLFPELQLIGLDVVLDLDAEGRVKPVFLEANPRPAGLGRSWLFHGFPLTDAGAPGVTCGLWEGLLADDASR